MWAWLKMWRDDCENTIEANRAGQIARALARGVGKR
jgi:hypothetical protein